MCEKLIINSFLEKKYCFGRTVMIIVPHQDDEINLAGSVIVSAIKKASKVVCVFVTNGDFDYAADVRINEAKKSLNVLGVIEDNIYFLGYGDNFNNFEQSLYINKNNIVMSHAGKKETYGGKNDSEYHYRKYGKHHAYKYENLVFDIKDIILDVLPDTIFAVDFDCLHHDHKLVSFAFEDAIGAILNRFENNYFPLILKGFCYFTAYFNEPDFYNLNFKSVTNKIKNKKFLPLFETDNPQYRWNERIRFPVDDSCRERLLKNNVLYKAMLKHHSQICIKQARNIINSDSVFWLRRTDSLIYIAKLEVSSGNSIHLKEFRTLNVNNILDVRNYYYSDYLWIPDTDDKEKFIICYFDVPQSISLCLLAGNIAEESQILLGKLEFSNGFSFTVNKLDKLGRDKRVSFPKQENIVWIKFKIITYCGTNPGLSKFEVYSNNTVNFKILKFMICDNFVYEWYILPHIKKLKFGLYKYGVEKVVIKCVNGAVVIKDDHLFFEKLEREVVIRIEDMFDSSCYDQVIIKRISYAEYFLFKLVQLRDYLGNWFLCKKN